MLGAMTGEMLAVDPAVDVTCRFNFNATIPEVPERVDDDASIAVRRRLPVLATHSNRRIKMASRVVLWPRQRQVRHLRPGHARVPRHVVEQWLG